MQIESGFSFINTVISAMRGHSEHMSNITSGVGVARRAVPEIVGTESDMGTEFGAGSFSNLIDLDNMPVRMTNLNVAAQAYEANVGVMGCYQQMTETKLELLG